MANIFYCLAHVPEPWNSSGHVKIESLEFATYDIPGDVVHTKTTNKNICFYGEQKKLGFSLFQLVEIFFVGSQQKNCNVNGWSQKNFCSSTKAWEPTFFAFC